jgi:PAS domain S-box-containing protein
MGREHEISGYTSSNPDLSKIDKYLDKARNEMNQDADTRHEQLIDVINVLRQELEHYRRNDEILRKSSERFQSYLKNSTEGMYCIEFSQHVDISMAEDEQIDNMYKYGYVGHANDVWARIAGHEQAEDLVGYRLEELIPRSIPENVTFLKKLIRAGYRLKDHETVEEYRTGVKLHGINTLSGTIENGHLLRLWGTGRDITDQKRIEKDLVMKESAIASSINAIGITDLEGTIIYVNNSLVTMWGYGSAGEILGRPLPEFWEGDRVFQTVKELQKQGWSSGEDIGKRKDGSLFNVQFFGSMIKDEAGTPLYMCGSFIDITEQKRAEETIRDSESRLKEAEKIARLGSWEWNIITNDLQWSDEIYRIFGLSPSNFGATYEAFINTVHPDDRKYVIESVDASLKNNKPYNIDHRIVLPDGTERIVHEMAIAEFNEDGNPIRMFGTVQDITDFQTTLLALRESEEKLLASQKDLRKLAGRLISNQEKEYRHLARELHDNITQQLAVIAIEAGNIEQQFNDLPEPVLQRISHIKDQLITVSKDVHSLSRDLHPSILEDLGLERAVRSECSNVSSRMGISVSFTPLTLPASVPDDIGLSIYRIVQEGLSNIVKHAKTKKAYVFLEGVNNSIMLTVRDTGVGFEPEQVRKKEGLGLGSIRERVRLAHGELSIISHPGKGTNVEVIFPLNEEEQ